MTGPATGMSPKPSRGLDSADGGEAAPESGDWGTSGSAYVTVWTLSTLHNLIPPCVVSCGAGRPRMSSTRRLVLPLAMEPSGRIALFWLIWERLPPAGSKPARVFDLREDVDP